MGHNSDIDKVKVMLRIEFLNIVLDVYDDFFNNSLISDPEAKLQKAIDNCHKKMPELKIFSSPAGFKSFTREDISTIREYAEQFTDDLFDYYDDYSDKDDFLDDDISDDLFDRASAIFDDDLLENTQFNEYEGIEEKLESEGLLDY